MHRNGFETIFFVVSLAIVAATSVPWPPFPTFSVWRKTFEEKNQTKNRKSSRDAPIARHLHKHLYQITLLCVCARKEHNNKTNSNSKID